MQKHIIQLDPSASRRACEEITETLPEWFGIPEANARYAQGVEERLSFGYIEGGTCLGLITLEFPFPGTASIYWMGVQKEAHGKGIGSHLLRHVETMCLQTEIFTLTVETLSPSVANVDYLKTFNFYLKAGFKPLFELNTYGTLNMVYLSKVLSPKIFKWIDLTHTLTEKIPSWEGSCGFEHQKISKSEDDFSVHRINMLAGIGTHMDAPLHCFKEGKAIDEIPVDSLVLSCVMIDVSKEADALYTVEMGVIDRFEDTYGEIAKNTFVIFYTGWERFWNDPEKYHNNHHFPSISEDVAKYLVSKDIAGIGIDTLSPDRGDSEFPVHKALLKSNKIIVENIANANQMPAWGGSVCIMPIKILKGTESPIRLLGIIS